MSGINCPSCIESWAAEECLPCWDVPNFKCACLDLSDRDHVELWEEAWKVASSYVFNATGQRWPGKCLTETVRPCVPRVCAPECCCYDCGRYEFLDLSDAFCWPVCEIVSVDIEPTACAPDGVTWTEGAGFRVERVMGCERLVLEDYDGRMLRQFPRQDLEGMTGGDGTWTITARTGCVPPAEVLRGTAALACDIAQQCIQMKCGLPRNATQASFNGVTVSYDNDVAGRTLELQMLKDVIARYQADGIVEQFLNPSRPVTFHHVDGPRRVEDLVVDDSCPVVPEAVVANPQPVVPNSLGVYSVSPIS